MRDDANERRGRREKKEQKKGAEYERESCARRDEFLALEREGGVKGRKEEVRLNLESWRGMSLKLIWLEREWWAVSRESKVDEDWYVQRRQTKRNALEDLVRGYA